MSDEKPADPTIYAPVPLTEPIPLIECCNMPPPGCGHCWYCLERAKQKAAAEPERPASKVAVLPLPRSR